MLKQYVLQPSMPKHMETQIRSIIRKHMQIELYEVTDYLCDAASSQVNLDMLFDSVPSPAPGTKVSDEDVLVDGIVKVFDYLEFTPVFREHLTSLRRSLFSCAVCSHVITSATLVITVLI